MNIDTRNVIVPARIGGVRKLLNRDYDIMTWRNEYSQWRWTVGTYRVSLALVLWLSANKAITPTYEGFTDMWSKR